MATYTDVASNPTTLQVATDYPEPLEKIFQRVEEESERRAGEQLHPLISESSQKVDVSATAKKTKARRRGSITISRIGQLTEDSKASQGLTRIPSIASHSPFYQAQIANASTASIASGASDLSETAHTEDDRHVTQMHQIAGKASISQKMGEMLPRRLSRARSSVIPAGDANMMIGVSVQEATIESSEDGPQTSVSRTSIHAPGDLRNQTSRTTLPGSTAVRSGWAEKAREFTQKFRRKSFQKLASGV